MCKRNRKELFQLQACMDLQQDLSKKCWIKNKQSPAGIQREEKERICTENFVCKLFPRGATETEKTSRCYLSFVPRERKLLCQAAQRVFYSLFLEEIDASSRFLVSQRIPTMCLC